MQFGTKNKAVLPLEEQEGDAELCSGCDTDPTEEGKRAERPEEEERK